jgi:hypothetical protein
MLKSLKKLLYQENLCYHGVGEKVRLQEQKFWGIFSGTRDPQNYFLPAVAWVAT